VTAVTAPAAVTVWVDFVPARLEAGEAPSFPVLTVGGAQVFLEVALDQGGRPIAVRTLRSTPGFTTPVADAVRKWRFHPAETIVAGRGRHSVGSSVFVAAVVRPPSFNAPTGALPPADVAVPIDDIAFPTAVLVPQHPPLVPGNGVVILEARVDATGAVVDTTALQSAPGFDKAAAEAMRGWRFRPARVHGAPVPTFVYVIVDFPAPVA
jgi:TonB family protein